MKRLASSSVACLALAGGTAWAQQQIDDPLVLSASYSVQTDSNLYRLSSSANVQATIGRSDAYEQIGITTVGLNFKTQQSLQQFELSATAVDYKYQNFDYLSYTATNYDAAWRWHVTPRLRGNLTTTRKEALNRFSDFSGTIRNVRLDTSSGLDTEYEIDGPWLLVGGVYSNRQENQAAAVSGSDYATNSADLGVRYAFSSGSAMTYRMRTNQGDYLNRTLSSTNLLDTSFKQTDHDFRLIWVIDGNVSANANLTYIKRTHPNFGQRDFDGFNTGIGANLQISGKTSVSAGYQHTLGVYATNTSNYSQTDSITLGPVWAISSKANLRLQTRYDQVQYLGSPNVGSSTDRRDTNRETTLSLAWQPYQRVSVGASVGTLSRGSNQAGLDFDSTQMGLSAQLSY